VGKLIRKNVFLDPEALKQAQQMLGKRSESETIRAALELVAFRHHVMTGYARAASKSPDFQDMWDNK
jgi:hypothetical protein